MIVKFFKVSGGSRGASNSMNYLLGQNRDREGARLLQGDPDLSIAIADGSGFKTRYTVGCLSFEEENIPEDQKREVMASFENTLLAGLEGDQYNITWVEHTDKGRLELNFFIPNVELETGKRLQPYYDKVDRGLVDSWKQVTNYQYGLTDPDEPTKKQVSISADNLPKAKKEAQEAITNAIEGLILAGEVKDRYGVLKALESAGLEVARVTKTSISIKDPDGGQNLRLKGFYYEQTFGISNELQETIRARSREHSQGLRTNVQEAQRKLEQLVERRGKQFSEKYRRAEQSIDSGLQAEDGRISKKPSIRIDDGMGFGSDSGRGFDSSSRDSFGDLVATGDVERVEPTNNEVRTSGRTERPTFIARGGDLVPDSSEEKERDLHQQEQRPRHEDQLGGSDENRVTTALRGAIGKFKEGLKRLGGAVQRVRESVKRPIANESPITRGQQITDAYKRAIERTDNALVRAERAIEQQATKVNQRIDDRKSERGIGFSR